MYGQHIFTRSFNENKKAGIWTAAVSENLLKPSLITRELEPHCALDESLASKNLLDKDRGILRFYKLSNEALVATRSFFVSDQITESSGYGRIVPYSISHIAIKEDAEKLLEDFEGIFCPECYETYEHLIKRANSKKLLVDESFSLFSHENILPDFYLFYNLGFDKKLFISFMQALYFCLENSRCMAVRLPKAYSNSGEKLCFLLMKLLLKITRKDFSFATNWTCKIDTSMLEDIRLVFVQPNSEEDLQPLKRRNSIFLDLENGTIEGNFDKNNEIYLSFLWDNLTNYEKINSFFNYIDLNYSDLFSNIPPSLLVMEFIYRLFKCQIYDFKDTQYALDTFVLSENILPGAGKRFPKAEKDIESLLRAINKPAVYSIDKVQETICEYLKNDKEKTCHRSLEIDFLFSACKEKTLSKEGITLLCKELNFSEEDYALKLQEFLNYSPDLDLACALFRFITENKEIEKFKELFSLLIHLMGQEETKEVLESFAFFLKNETDFEQITVYIYEILFRLLYQKNNALAKDILLSELKTSLNKEIFAQYLTKYFSAYKGQELLELSYNFLFTLLNSEDEKIFSSMLNLCEERIAENGEEFFDYRKKPLKESALNKKVVIETERLRLKYLPKEVPEIEIFDYFDDRELSYFFDAYNKNMNEEERNILYKALQQKGKMNFLFVASFYGENSLWKEIEEFSALDHKEKLRQITKNPYRLNISNESAFTEKFMTWYSKEIGEEIYTVFRDSKTSNEEKFSNLYDFLAYEEERMDNLSGMPSTLSNWGKLFVYNNKIALLNKFQTSDIVNLPFSLLEKIVKNRNYRNYKAILKDAQIYELCYVLSDSRERNIAENEESIDKQVLTEAENYYWRCKENKTLLTLLYFRIAHLLENREENDPQRLRYIVFQSIFQNEIIDINDILSKINLKENNDVEILLNLVDLIPEELSFSKVFYDAVSTRLSNIAQKRTSGFTEKAREQYDKVKERLNFQWPEKKGLKKLFGK